MIECSFTVFPLHNVLVRAHAGSLIPSFYPFTALEERDSM